MKLQEVTAYNLRSQNILNESWDTLTESQRIYIGKWERELWPLLEEYVRVCEADLTQDQIKNIFTSAEQQAAGQKTGIGKAASAAGAALKLPVELAKKVDAKINELGRMAQNAGPVKNADQKFEELKKQITANNSDSKIVQGIQKISDWAKENPGKASLAVGILTTMAAFAGGPAGGAAAGLILRASKDLLQGEKLSTAVGKSIKTGVYGALAGMAFKELTDNVVDNIASAQNAELDAMEAAMKAENFQNAKADLFADLGMDVNALDGASKITMNGNLNQFYYSYDTVIPPDMMPQYEALADAMRSADSFSPEHYAAAAKFHDFMGGLVNTPEAKNLTAAWDALKEIPKDQLTSDNLTTLINQADSGSEILDTLIQTGDTAAAAAQGAIQTVDDNAKKAQTAKPVDPETKKELEAEAETKAESLTIEEKYELYLQEGPLADKLKGAAGKAAGAVKGAAGKAAGAVKQAGKDITQQVTANKLMKAWKAAGEPTDTGSIVNILASAGVSDDQIATIGQEQKVKLPAPTKAPAADKAAVPQAGGEQPAAAPQAGGEQPAAAPQAGGAVDVKSIAAEIKKLPPEAVQEIKAALQKEIGTPAAKPRTGGKQKGVLSQTPSAIRRRQATAARRAADAGLSVSKPAAAPAAPAAPKVKK